MIPNKIFKWLAIALIAYLLITNRSGLHSPLPHNLPANTTAASSPNPAQPVNSIVKPPVAVPDPKENIQPGQPIAAQESATGNTGKTAPVMESAIERLRKTNGEFSIWDVMQAGNNGMRYGVLINDVKEGSGEKALCGEEVSIHYTIATPEGKEIATSRKDNQPPVSLHLGEGKLIKGIESGIIGMKKGGVRKLIIPPNTAFAAKEFKGQGPADTRVIAEVELVDHNTLIAKNKGKMPLRLYDDSSNVQGNSIFCGQKITVNYKIWDMDGNLLASTMQEDGGGKTKEMKNVRLPGKSDFSEVASMPMLFKLGEGKVPLAFELAVAGDGERNSMKVGGKRSVIAPAFALKTLTGKVVSPALLSGVRLPNKTVLIEIEVLSAE